jgi:hypothetical protein
LYKRLLIVFILFISVILPNIIHAQRSIGKVETKDYKDTKTEKLDYRVIDWIGKTFIFLEQPKSLQQYGYKLYLDKIYSIKRGYNPELETDVKDLRYDKFVGKIIKVIEIENDPSWHGDYTVTFNVEELNKKIYGSTYKGYIDGIALFDDLSKAKKRWLGKTIYSKWRVILTYSAGLNDWGEEKIKIGDPLKVKDIWWGFYSTRPLWIIVETARGEKGYIDTAFSWTNIYSDRWTENRPWENDLFEFNPKKKYNWSSEIWELINNGEVRIGMNKEQARLSWGKPEKINKDIYEGRIKEQWIYKVQYLYFENDKLTAIQIR